MKIILLEFMLKKNYPNFPLKNILNILDNKWNYMPFLKNSISIARPNFFHFVGIHGKQLVQLILKHKFEINDFLKKATFNH